MRILEDVVTLSATDLANHLSCRHLTTLDYRLAKGELTEPSWDNPHLVVLQQRGLEHERAYVETLRSRGLSVVDLAEESEETASEATWKAMQSGAQAIIQGSLAVDGWRGRADVFPRVERPEYPCRLGHWSYNRVDPGVKRSIRRRGADKDRGLPQTAQHRTDWEEFVPIRESDH